MAPGRLAVALFVGLCLCLAPAAAGAAPAAQQAGPAANIVHVMASQRDATTTVSVATTAPPTAFYAFKETSPLRVVVELEDVGPGEDTEALEVNDGLVSKVGRSMAAVNGRAGTRLEIDLCRDANFNVSKLDGKLLITLAPEGEPMASPVVAPEQPAPEPQPEQAMSAGAADSAPGSPCRLEALQFKSLPSGKARVLVNTSAKAGYELARVSRDTLSLTLRQCKLPAELSRPLDTGQFEQAAIDDVSPAQSGADTVVSIRFRQVVPYHLMQEGGELSLEFDAGTARPNPEMALRERDDQQGAAAAEPAPAAQQEDEDAAARQAATEQAVERTPEQVEASHAAAPPQPEPAHIGSAVRVIYPGTQRHFSGQRISLDFQSADVHNVLRLIAEVSGLNIITSDNVKGRVTMRLKKVPWDQALDLILATCNLAMSRSGDVIRIAPAERFREEQKQAESAAKDALDAARKKEQLVPLLTRKFRVNYGKAEDMEKQIEEVLSPRGKVSFDERTNVVIVTDVKESVERARDLIESLDWPTPQVMIEARIVEAQTTFSRELGTQWGASFERTYGSIDGTIGVQGRTGVTGAPSGVPFLVNLPTTTTYGGIGVAYLSNFFNVDARLLASEQQGKLRIISSPRIATLDNTEAYIQQGEDIPYLSQSVDGISTQFVQTKLCLTVTPHITPDGRVRMRIKAEKSEPSDREINGTPGILRKETVTEVLVNNGETVVLGGILKDKSTLTDQQIPFFHKIPILGWLFKAQLKDQEKQELLIFITPKIIDMAQVTQAAI